MTWRYHPIGRLDRWSTYLARHDLLPKGCLVKWLRFILKRHV